MSDAGAPAAAVESAPADAPSEKPDAGDGAVAAPTAPPKPRTIDDDLEDVLKKHGGYEYAKGKKLDSAANLKRMLGRVTGVDSAAGEALKAKQEADGLKSKLAAIGKLQPSERVKALESIGVDPKLIREAVEESILAEDARARAEQGMSERERQQARLLEEREAELQEHRTKAQAAEAEQKQREFMAEMDQNYNQMIDASAKAFELAGIPKGSPELVLQILPALAERLDRNKRLGLSLDPVELAEVATQERSKIVNDWNAARPLEDLAASLEAIQTTEDDPHRPGKKMSKLRQLLLHEAAKLRAKVTGGVQSAPVARAANQNHSSSMTMAEKMAAARTFGGR